MQLVILFYLQLKLNECFLITFTACPCNASVMDIDDLDSHICLQCHKHIIGLPNYVHHKKYDCPIKRHDSPATADAAVPQTRDLEQEEKLDSEEIRKSSLDLECVKHEGDPGEKTSGHKQQSDECNKTEATPLKRKVGRPPKHVKTEAVQEETTTDGETSQIINNTVDGKDTAESKTKENVKTQGCVFEENVIKSKTTESVPRRRGRPRKYPLVHDEKQQKTDDPSTADLQVGNGPEKQKTGDCTIKRRVGRPRKIKLEGDKTEKSDPASSDATDELKTNHTVTISNSSVTPGVKRNLSPRGAQTSPRKRHERYDGSDLYKPRLSLGGSRQRARQMEESVSESLSSSIGLISLAQKEKHQSLFSKAEKNKHFRRKQNMLKSPKIALPGSERPLRHPKNTSFSSLDSLTDSKRHLKTYPPPEPEIISQLCQLRLRCHVESELYEPAELNDRNLEQAPAALRLVNMLNELNCDSDYEGLDHLPDIEHSDVDKHRKVTDIEVEETTNKSDAEEKNESSGSPKTKDPTDVYKITASGYSFVLKLICQNCNRYFINALAYHSHIKCAQCKNDSYHPLHENTQEPTDQTDRNSSREPVDQADELSSFSDTKQVTHIQVPDHNEKLQDSNENSKQPDENIFIETCPGCRVMFDNKYAYCKHLLHALGLQETSDPQLQRLMVALKSYQCHLCVFYCSSLADFLKHVGSLEHSEVVDKLLGDMVCIDCQYMTSSKKNIYLHFQSLHQQPDRPCLLKEVNQVQSCRFCGKTFHSSRAMRIHTAIEPGHRRASQHSTWCNICKKAFSTTTNLQQHIWRMHDHTKNFTCHICNKNYSYKNNLDMHYKSQMHKANVRAKAGETGSNSSEDVSESEASTGDTTVKNTTGVKVKQEPGIADAMGQEDGEIGSCSMEKETSGSDPSFVVKRGRGRPRKHNITATEECKTYKCELCGYTLYSPRQLEKHQQSRYHIRTEEDAAKSTECFTCTVCQHKFYCKERFALHKLAHKDKSKHVGIGLRRMNRLRGIPERFHKLALSLPKKVKSEVQCPDCQGWFKVNTIIPHIRCKHGEGNDLPYKCNFCPLTFASNSSLYRHHKRHVGLLSFQCKICNKGFRSKSDLESHELTFHKDELQIEPKLQCYLCGAGFMQQSKLNTHMKQKHEKVRKYWCSWPGCHRAFIHQQEYVIHMRGHTGEKPYLCDHCGFATKSKVQLARHERIHKNVANYKCKYCSYTSRMSAGLRRHMRLHTGAKPYRCPHCEHRCYSHTNLRLHINNSRLHPMLKLYNCRFCQFASNATTDFLSHMFEAHGLRPEVIGNVAEYCGVYLPQEDVTEVKEGCEPLQLAKRKPRCKVSNNVKLQDAPASEPEVMMEHAIVMKVEPDVNNMCIIESDETVADQAGMHREIQENNIVCYQQHSTEKAPKLASKHNSQKYQVLSIRETPEGNIVFVDVRPPEEEHLTDGEHEAEQEQSIVAEGHVMETVYIPKVEKEEVIQSDIDQETSIIVHNDPGQEIICAETSKPENIVYIQEQETPLAVMQQTTEQIGEDTTVEGNLTLATQEVTEQVKQVYLTSEGIQLTELIQGLEDTGAIVELRMEDDCDVPEGKPGQVVQVIGDDNKPVHFYYV